MNLNRLLRQRAAEDRPIRVGVIGCGKFAAMFLAQIPATPGLEIAAIADLAPDRARARLRDIGWTEERIAATRITDDAGAVLAAPDLAVIVEATGDAVAGVGHALQAIAAGKHLVMVNVEADVLCGVALARRAAAAGLVYSLAYGDQPALIAEQVDWARACGLEVMAAGKGTKYLPVYHRSTPDTVWGHYGLTPERAAAGGMNPKMFNSFLDGTKSAIEMAAVANACALEVPEAGLAFPACGVDDLPFLLRPRSEGGVLEGAGMVEVISSLERDGRPVHRDLRWGVYVVFKAQSDYAARCFAEYGLTTSPCGRYAALYRPYHLIGLELGVSVASAALRGEATGAPDAWRGDVAATAKRDLAVGEMLDGEGGHCIYGRLVRAARAATDRLLPIGLASGVRLRRPVAMNAQLSLDDVEIDPTLAALALRAELQPAA
ncbi:MAG: flagellar biosynthesis protein FlgA [Geminicoccaceae bacterium]